MNGARRNKKGVARRYVEPGEQVLDVAGDSGLSHLFLCDRLAKSSGNFRPRLGCEHIPHFGFSPALVMDARVSVVGMHLHREFLRCKDKLDQERRVFHAFKPCLAHLHLRVWEPGLEMLSAPDLLSKTGRESARQRHLWDAHSGLLVSRPRSSWPKFTALGALYLPRSCRAAARNLLFCPYAANASKADPSPGSG